MYKLFCVPDWLGSTYKSGVEKGANRIVESIFSSSDLRYYFHNEVINVAIPEPSPKHLIGVYQNVKFLPEIKEVCLNIQKCITDRPGANSLPLFLLGNDSAMIGVGSGLVSLFGENMGLIYFDAHGDLNTPETSPSGRIFGMPLAHLLGFGHPELTALNHGPASVKPHNILLLGSRCLDAGEKVLIEAYNLTHFGPSDLEKNDNFEVLNSINAKFKNVDSLLVHIDLDVLDPIKSPGVTMHEPGGLSPDTLLTIFKHLLAITDKKVLLSLSEYNPDRDPNQMTLQIILELIRVYVTRSAGV